MTELNTPDRDDGVGRALRSLDVGASRLDFWDDVRSDLVVADASDGIAPHWIASPDDDEGPSALNRRRVWSAKPWLALAAAAAVVIIVGLAIVLRPGGNDTTQLDVANPDVANPDGVDPAEPDGQVPPTADEPVAVGADGAAAAVDYSQEPAVADLPSGSLVVAGAPTQGLIFIDWPVPGTAEGGCESATGRYGLLPAVNSGEVLIEELAGLGSQHSFVEASGGLGVLRNLCGEQIQLVELGEQGDVRILARPQAPDGQQLMGFPAVWSDDESQFYLHASTEPGVLSLLAYDVPEDGDGGPLEPSATIEISDGAPKRVLAEFGGGSRAEAVDGVITIDGEQVATYLAGEGPGNVVAKRSIDGSQVAIGANGVLTIADADGVVASFETGGPVIQALDWSSTGQLLFSPGGHETGVLVYTPGAPDGDAFSLVANTRGVVWLELEVADNGTVVALSGFNEFAQAKILTFPGNHRVPALDPEKRLIVLEAPAQTVGDQPLTLRGMGAIETGMTVAQAEEAVGGTLVDLSALDGCGYSVLAGDPLSPSFMVITWQEDGNLPYEQGRILRIELGPDNATLSGIRLGSTEDEVRAAYGDRIEVTPHKYTFDQGGEYFTFVPADSADSDYRVVMETLDDRVTQVRSGLLPVVEFVEGCA